MTADPWWKSTWPLHRHDAATLLWALMAVVAVGVLVGWLYTDVLAPNALTDWDESTVERFADSRTDTRDGLASWGARLADTPVKIAATAVVVVLLVAWLRRWHEAVFATITLIFEATAFIIITFIVSRPRPDVDRLVTSPVDSSFPSGHVAAATVYGALVIVVFWHTRSWWLRGAAIVLAAAVVVAVALSRVYQGVHYPVDVIAGVVLGLVSLAICHHVLGPPSGSAIGRSESL